MAELPARVTGEHPLRVFISFRHKEAAVEADLLQQTLCARGLVVAQTPRPASHGGVRRRHASRPPSSTSCAATTAQDLQSTDVVVIIATKHYGKRTSDPLNTHNELRHIMHSRKPMFLISRCSGFKYRTTRFWLGTNREPAYTWPISGTSVHAHALPRKLVSSLIAYLQHIQHAQQRASCLVSEDPAVFASASRNAFPLPPPLSKLNVCAVSARHSLSCPSALRRQSHGLQHQRTEAGSPQQRLSKEKRRQRNKPQRSSSPTRQHPVNARPSSAPATHKLVTSSQPESRTTSAPSLPQSARTRRRKRTCEQNGTLAAAAATTGTSKPRQRASPPRAHTPGQTHRSARASAAFPDVVHEREPCTSQRARTVRRRGSAPVVSRRQRPSTSQDRRALRRGSSLSLATCTSTASTSTSAAVDDVLGNMEELPMDVDVLEYGCMALQTSIDRDGACTQRCLSMMLHALRMTKAPESLHAAALGVLMTAATRDKDAGPQLKGPTLVEAVVQSMQRHSDSACVQLLGCELLKFVTESVSNRNSGTFPHEEGEEEGQRSAKGWRMEGKARKRGKDGHTKEKGGVCGSSRCISSGSFDTGHISGVYATVCRTAEAEGSISKRGEDAGVMGHGNVQPANHSSTECACTDPRARVACRGGLQAITAAMATHRADAHIQRTGCEVLDNAARAGARVRRAAAASGAIDQLVKTLKSHADDADMQRYGLTALLHLVGNAARLQRRLVNIGGVEAVITVLHQHEDNTSAVLAALATLDGLLMRGFELCSECGDQQHVVEDAPGNALHGKGRLENVAQVVRRVHAAGALAATVATMERWPTRISVQMGGLNVLHKLLVTRSAVERNVVITANDEQDDGVECEKETCHRADAQRVGDCSGGQSACKKARDAEEDANVVAVVANTLHAFATHSPVVNRARRVLQCFA